MEEKELSLETQYLHETLALVQENLKAATGNAEAHAETIRSIQEDRMRENPMDIGGMYSSQGFLDLLEASQGTQLLAQMASTKQNTDRTIRLLLQMLDSPYFARIDFRFEDGRVSPVYIGKTSLSAPDSLKMKVFDWRAPISSAFYQYGVGPASYEAPAGTIHGDILLKRQYEIRGGKLLYYFDADEQVLDAFLRDLLSQPASTQMKSIVESIQRDQDHIIRDLKTDLLMVQGVAGSGKTSVALHRVAYLMYQGLQQNHLRANELLILAPNAVFEQYISNVLPDLGEAHVQTKLFDELLSELLPQSPIETRSGMVEAYLLEKNQQNKAELLSIRRFKSSSSFAQILNRLMNELPQQWLPFCDVEYDGQCVATREWMLQYIDNPGSKAPLGARLRMLEAEIWERIHRLWPARQAKLLQQAGDAPEHALEVQAYARMLSIQESGCLFQQIRTFTHIDCVALYRALFTHKEAFARLAHGLCPPSDVEPIRRATAERLAHNQLPYEDAVAAAYLQMHLYGTRAYAHLRQVVVDEAQDLDAMHAALLGMLFPNARFTLLGDVQQSLAGTANEAIYEEIQHSLHKPNALLVTLDKSFRCTREIWVLGAQFLPSGAAGECFSRSGEKPRIYSAENGSTLDALLVQQAEGCLQAGWKSVALLCKTQREAGELYESLKGQMPLSLLMPGEAGKTSGIVVTSLLMAKGLEFDAVLFCGVDRAHYSGTGDANLLYIGCSRALHILRLFYTGERSPLLPINAEVLDEYA